MRDNTKLKLIQFQNSKGEDLRGVLSPSSSHEAVVMVHGFERSSIEKKFANIEKRLRGDLVCLRFDHSDCGLSDGDFSDVTVEKRVDELQAAIRAMKKEQPHIQQISLVAHSLGACVAVKYAVEHPDNTKKLILLSPALNQRELLRYWFVSSTVKDIDIEWKNYKQYLDEQEFQKFVENDKKVVSEHYLGPEYHLENKDQDYQKILSQLNPQNVVLIYGTEDKIVPFQSNSNIDLKNKILKVNQGDHDLEHPSMVEQYFDYLTNFLKS